MPRPKDIDTEEGRQRHEAKYQRILDAALDVFARKGFHEAKISEIARAAGVADGTIYLYFKNKDDLLISLFESKLEQINEGLRNELKDITDARERLQHIIRYHLRLALENPTLAAFITIELRRSGKFMKDYAKAQLSEYLTQWGNVIDEGKASGQFRSDMSTGILKHILFGALDHACVTWVNNPQRRPEDLTEVGEHLNAMVMHVVNAQS
ncbi:MAG TPA: TetR/AcrR family transcriptional regulator [Myxococcota bacterium]|jgi:TetR/AcrR family fatty acid metabolism transcriptional regulator|nr:TetR/AcrR family transcriptional regulator [Myxococcota bacterium]